MIINIDVCTIKNNKEKAKIPKELIANLDLTSGKPVTESNLSAKTITRNNDDSITATAAPSILNIKIRLKFNTTLNIVATD